MRLGVRFGLLLVAAWFCGVAKASPLTTSIEPNGSSAVTTWSAPSNEDLAKTNPILDTAPAALEFGAASALDSAELAALIGPNRDLREPFRKYVNVEGARSGTAAAAARSRATQDGLGLVGTEFGAAANEWLQDTVQGLLQSTLRLEVNERGRASFSVLGLGDFSVTVAGNRSEITLAAGDDVLLAAQRPMPLSTAAVHGRYADESVLGYAPSARPEVLGSPESALRQAMALFAELITHPLSLLVYCLLAAYALLWAVLSQRRRRFEGRARANSFARFEPMAATSSVARRAPRRRSMRSASSETPGNCVAAAAETTAAAPAKRRQRIRVRIRTRIRRSASIRRA